MSEPLSQETSEAAAAFAEYCAMGLGRSLEGLVKQRIQNGSKASLRLATIKGWSSKHHWQDRVKVYDAEQIEAKRLKRDAEIEKMNIRHAMIGTTQQAKAIEQIERLVKAEKFGSQATVQLLKLATDLERLARGAATERTEVTGKDGGPIKVDSRDYSRFTDEELAILEQLAQKVNDGGS